VSHAVFGGIRAGNEKGRAGDVKMGECDVVGIFDLEATLPVKNNLGDVGGVGGLDGQVRHFRDGANYLILVVGHARGSTRVIVVAVGASLELQYRM
jgi:hypothetical protein